MKLSKSNSESTKPDWMGLLRTSDRDLLEMMDLDWPGAAELIGNACARYARLRASCDPHELARAAQAAIDGYRRARAARASDRGRLCAFAAALAEALDLDLDPVLPESLHILRDRDLCALEGCEGAENSGAGLRR